MTYMAADGVSAYPTDFAVDVKRCIRQEERREHVGGIRSAECLRERVRLVKRRTNDGRFKSRGVMDLEHGSWTNDDRARWQAPGELLNRRDCEPETSLVRRRALQDNVTCS